MGRKKIIDFEHFCIDFKKAWDKEWDKTLDGGKMCNSFFQKRKYFYEKKENELIIYHLTKATIKARISRGTNTVWIDEVDLMAKLIELLPDYVNFLKNKLFFND